jgi:hypothetical protein
MLTRWPVDGFATTTMMKVTRAAAFALYYNHYHGVLV